MIRLKCLFFSSRTVEICSLAVASRPDLVVHRILPLVSGPSMGHRCSVFFLRRRFEEILPIVPPSEIQVSFRAKQSSYRRSMYLHL